jgi:hypothetical protein
MRVFAVFSLLTVIVACLAEGDALAADSSAAIDELKAGYALKQQGQCERAIPHFLASYHADPKPKALLNLADCEQRLHLLLSATEHAKEGLNLARQANDEALVDVAQGQLDTIDHKLPRLIVRMAPSAPPGATAILDGAALGVDAMDAPVPLDPRGHRVIVTAPGHAQREFDIPLVEGQHAEIEVEPGMPTGSDAAPAEATLPPSGSENGGSPARQLLTYGVLGIGGAGIAAGVAVGVAAGSKHGTIERECNGNSCPPTAQGDIDSFHTLRTWSTVGYAVGFAGVAAGAVLWLTAPKSDTTATAVWLGPASAGVSGRF